MKRTEMERREREQARKEKKSSILAKRGESREDMTPGAFIKLLSGLFMHDGETIYNLDASDDILENIWLMKETLAEKQWEKVIRNAVKQTKIQGPGREAAVKKLISMLQD